MTATLRELSFFTGRGGRRFVGGDQFFFSGPKGGGDQNFFRVKKGGPKFFCQIFFAPLAQCLLNYIIQKISATSAQPFPLPYFMPHNMFIYSQYSSSMLWHLHFNLITAFSIGSFALGGGTRIFSQGQRGGPKFFSGGKGGGTRKNWQPAITDRRPPHPGKKW